MAFTEDEIARVRKHLGYPAVNPGQAMAFSYPVISDPQFLFESSLQAVRPSAEPQIRKLIQVLDQLECKEIEIAIASAPAVSSEDVKMNLDEPAWLADRVRDFAYRLADLLGCPVCPFCERLKPKGKVAGMIAVR